MNKLTFGGLMQQTFGTFADVFQRLFPALFAYSLISSIFIQLAAGSLLDELGRIFRTLETPAGDVLSRAQFEDRIRDGWDALAKHQDTYALMLLAIVIIGVALSTLRSIHAIHVIANVGDEEQTSISSGFRVARQKFWRTLGANALVALILIGTLFGIALVGSIVSLALPALLLILVPVGFCLFFYLAIRLVCVRQIIVLEDALPIASLTRSSKLVHSHYWLLVGFFIVYSLIIAVGGGIVNGLAQKIVSGFFQHGEVREWAFLVEGALFAAVLAMFGAAAMVAVYKALNDDLLRRETPEVPAPTQVIDD